MYMSIYKLQVYFFITKEQLNCDSCETGKSRVWEIIPHQGVALLLGARHKKKNLPHAQPLQAFIPPKKKALCSLVVH